jgi:hypothetical protein
VATKFFTNVWTEPKLIEKNGWYGLQFALSSAENDIRLKNISYLMTYYTRPDCPLIWASFELTNNSKMTLSLESHVCLFLQPIETIHFPWNNELFTGVKSNRAKNFSTVPPHNWAIVDWGKDNMKALISSTNPRFTLFGSYTNANNNSEVRSFGTFTLRPGETRRNDLMVVFSKELDVLKTFKQQQHVLRL